jgi:hypothetical protein
MATAAQVIKASLQRILVQASEAELEPDEYQDAIFTLNNMMLDWDASGLNLGFTEIQSLGDEVTVPTGALRGIIANLAIEVSPDYNGQITQALANTASEGLRTIRKLAVAKPVTKFPCTLPMGSGNSQSVFNDNFYPCSEDEILAETTGAIALESGTNEAI